VSEVIRLSLMCLQVPKNMGEPIVRKDFRDALAGPCSGLFGACEHDFFEVGDGCFPIIFSRESECQIDRVLHGEISPFA
jgi:hypothetical protein